MSIIIPPFLGSPAAAPSGGGLVYDEVWLREPRLLVPRVQPLGPVKVDWSNPLARGLTFLWVASQRIDLVSGVLATNIGAGVFAPKDGNLAYSAVAGTSNGLSFGEAIRQRVTPNGSVTYTIFSITSASASATRSRLFGNGTEAAPPYAQICFLANAAAGISASGKFEINEYDGASKFICYTTDSGIIDGTRKSLCAVRLSASTGALYANGAVVGSAVIGSSTANVAVGQTYISNLLATNTASTSPHEMCAVWGTRALSESEVAEMSRNPYQFLIPA